MAASGGRKTSSVNTKTSKSGGTAKKKTAARTRSSSGKGRKDAARAVQDRALFHEIGLIVLFALMVFLFFCNFGVIGPGGNAVSGFLFGMFGLTAYVLPVLIFLAVAFWFANEGNPSAARKLAAGIVLFLMAGIVCDLLFGTEGVSEYHLAALYEECREHKTGGGILAGSISYLLRNYLGVMGSVLVVLLCSVISLILLTEKSLIDSVKKGGKRVREFSREDAARRREQARTRQEEQEQRRARREEERRLRAEEKENEKILRMERKVSGVMRDTALSRPEEKAHRDDIHEIVYSGNLPIEDEYIEQMDDIPCPAEMPVRTMAEEAYFEEPAADEEDSREQGDIHELTPPAFEEAEEQVVRIHKADIREDDVTEQHNPVPEVLPAGTLSGEKSLRTEEDGKSDVKDKIPDAKPVQYKFPPISLLHKGAAAAGDSVRELKETAMRLQQTLGTFGVRVTVTDISQGPSITRYELQPEQGVKVSKIVGLADDIKLNLAATDIRIEAPIPGKAAVGIEVPNKESIPVLLRDLLEAKEFRDFPSRITFAVGKDIAGKVVVADIAKMPHMLIAGATGSGKSVCINTLIMSILYKAHPDEVKLIMVDPKVVELSIYNGIPHLLIPVVTDPKKASAALHWGVAEMEDRYRKFAEFNVRDLAGYNKKVEGMREKGETNAPAKLPQIVIIVDELADLMMVCPGEVEESICRLAQLARACGIHLIIATQRPSVDVITGLIKANMPSRAAFAVSSGVDSRTILDMVGAEKLLGKGDMLFYPQGYPKPARIQGAFVSDGEVSDVVDYLKNQVLGNTYAEDIEEKIKSIGSTGGSGETSGGSDVDELFERAGRLIIDKDKASIGMLQRALQIGFNRAARIMDQLCRYGVVGEEEGTKPRKILMSPEQFEQLLEEVA